MGSEHPIFFTLFLVRGLFQHWRAQRWSPCLCHGDCNSFLTRKLELIECFRNRPSDLRINQKKICFVFQFLPFFKVYFLSYVEEEKVIFKMHSLFSLFWPNLNQILHRACSITNDLISIQHHGQGIKNNFYTLHKRIWKDRDKIRV